MTYKELFPETVRSDCQKIKNYEASLLTREIIDAVIADKLDDAFQRGVKYGTDAVLSDPQAYDLVSSDRGGN